MNDNFTNTTLLIRYMDNELSDEEQLLLQKKLDQDIELQNELDNLQYTRLSVNGFGLRKQVSAVHEEVMKELRNVPAKPAGIVRSMARMSLRIAAGLLVLAMAGAAYQYITVSPEKLANENYKAYTIGTSRAADELLPIEKAFQQKDFNTVLNLFNAINEPQPRDYFLAGTASLETGDITHAILRFTDCIAKNKAFQTTSYLEDSEYFLAISYLKNKEADKALPLLEKIHNQPLHLYHDKVSSWFIQKVKVAGWKQ